jgi:hypothetical protein
LKIILTTLKKILFWSYERGSWQYDIMCVLILAFIFLSPNRLFQRGGESRPRIERGDLIGKLEPAESGSIQDISAEGFQRGKRLAHRRIDRKLRH